MSDKRRYFKYTRMTLPLEYNTLSEHTVWRPAAAADDLTNASAALAAGGDGTSLQRQSAGSTGAAGSQTGSAAGVQQTASAAGADGGAPRWWGRRRRPLWPGVTYTDAGGAPTLPGFRAPQVLCNNSAWLLPMRRSCRTLALLIVAATCMADRIDFLTLPCGAAQEMAKLLALPLS